MPGPHPQSFRFHDLNIRSFKSFPGDFNVQKLKITSPGNISSDIYFRKEAFNYSYNKYQLNIHYNPSPMLGAWDTDINKAGRNTATMIPNGTTSYQ